MADKEHDANAKRAETRTSRRARLERELRANLLKRKEQGRAREQPGPLAMREDRQGPKE